MIDFDVTIGATPQAEIDARAREQRNKEIGCGVVFILFIAFMIFIGILMFLPPIGQEEMNYTTAQIGGELSVIAMDYENGGDSETVILSVIGGYIRFCYQSNDGYMFIYNCPIDRFQRVSSNSPNGEIMVNFNLDLNHPKTEQSYIFKAAGHHAPPEDYNKIIEIYSGKLITFSMSDAQYKDIMACILVGYGSVG